MRRSSAFSVIVLCAVAAASEADAKLDLYIDKSTQQISVIRNGALLYVWPVSTGRDRFSTPSGVYTPERLEPIWYSKAYYNAPMPHAIFFHQGYAIHGSYDISQLGGPASHGCVRLHPQQAALLYAMVEQEGPANTTIIVGGGTPNPLPPRYRDPDEAPRPPYVPDGGILRGAYPPNAGAAPYYDAYRDPYQYADRPGRRRGDNSRLAMREAYPPSRPSAPRLDAEPPFEPTLDPRGRYRPPAPPLDAEATFEPAPRPRDSYWPPAPRFDGEASIEPTPGPRGRYRPPAPRFDGDASIEPTPGPRGSYRLPATAKTNSKCPTCSPSHTSDERTTRNVSASQRVKSLPSSSLPPASPPPASPPPSEPSASIPSAPPASPQPPSSAQAASSTAAAPQPSEQQQPNTGYKVLPRSYWAGASWRWRLKAEHEIDVPSLTPDSH
jgi:hypothetical protein